MVNWKTKRFADKIQIEQTSTVLEPSSPFTHYMNQWLLKIYLVRMYLIWIHNKNVFKFHCMFRTRYVFMKPTLRTCSVQLTIQSTKANYELVNTVSNFMSLSRTKLFKTNTKMNQKENRFSYSSPNWTKLLSQVQTYPNQIKSKEKPLFLPFNHARILSESRSGSNSQDRFLLNKPLDSGLA